MGKKLYPAVIAGAFLLIACGGGGSITDDGNSTQISMADNVSLEDGGWEGATDDGLFYADLNHDGLDESIQIIVDNRADFTTVEFTVYQGDTLLYEEEMENNAVLGYKVYLVRYENQDYLMRYRPLIDHDAASCGYEVFSLKEGEPEMLDESEIEADLFHIDEMNSQDWLRFAEKENVYFSDSILIVSTQGGELVCGDPVESEGGTENFSWMLYRHEATESAEKNLEFFIEETREVYGE